MFLFHVHFFIVPDGSPVNVTILILSALTANITWKPPLYLARNGRIIEYTVNITDRLGVFSDPVITTTTYFFAEGYSVIMCVCLINKL